MAAHSAQSAFCSRPLRALSGRSLRLQWLLLRIVSTKFCLENCAWDFSPIISPENSMTAFFLSFLLRIEWRPDAAHFCLENSMTASFQSILLRIQWRLSSSHFSWELNDGPMPLTFLRIQWRPDAAKDQFPLVFLPFLIDRISWNELSPVY